MTSQSRRKHQTTAQNHPHPIHRDESCAGRNAFVQRLKRLAIGGVLIAGSAVTGLTAASAQDHIQTAHRPRLLRTPVHATQNSPEQSAAGTSSALIRIKGHESPSQTAAQLSPYSDIQVPENPLRPRGDSLNQNRTLSNGDRDISRSVSEILSAGERMTRVRQASALQEIEFDEFDESDVEIIELEPGDSSEGWQERRHVKEVVTPFPLKLSAARNDEMVEPKDDPFGDSAQSVLKGPSRNQSISYPKQRLQNDRAGENGAGDNGAADNGEEIELGMPKRDTDRDTDRDTLPAKRDQDRQFEANCDDVASEVATRSVSQITLVLQPMIQGDDALPLECPMAQVGSADRCWNAQTFTFTASALCHKPLYFEDIQLERYGHSGRPLVQPIKSAAHFFVRLGLLPYQMGIHPPNECVYALGYYRPGDCAPWLKDPFPLSGRGLLYEAGFAVGAAAVIP